MSHDFNDVSCGVAILYDTSFEFKIWYLFVKYDFDDISCGTTISYDWYLFDNSNIIIILY